LSLLNGWGSGWFRPGSAETAAPWAMERAGSIDPLETMRTEKVALRLDQVGGAAPLAIGVEIGESRRKRRHRQAGFRCTRHNAAQRGMRLSHHVDERRRHQKVDVGASL